LAGLSHHTLAQLPPPSLLLPSSACSEGLAFEIRALLTIDGWLRTFIGWLAFGDGRSYPHSLGWAWRWRRCNGSTRAGALYTVPHSPAPPYIVLVLLLFCLRWVFSIPHFPYPSSQAWYRVGLLIDGGLAASHIYTFAQLPSYLALARFGLFLVFSSAWCPV